MAAGARNEYRRLLAPVVSRAAIPSEFNTLSRVYLFCYGHHHPEHIGDVESRPMAANCLIAATCLLLATGVARPFAQDQLPLEFQGEWVPASGGCLSPARFHVAQNTVTLMNGQDRAEYRDVAIAYSFFGRDYEGISVVAIPEISSGNAPFTIFFNEGEVKGRTVLDIYYEIKGSTNPQVEAIQAASRKLAQRFPLNAVALKKCPVGKR